jgi:hypothetical protein
VQKLAEVFATKEDFSGFRDEYRNDFSDLQTSLIIMLKRRMIITGRWS